MALRTALPAGSRSAPLAVRSERTSPALIPALGGAVPIIVILIGGQLLFASKTFDVQKVALNESIQMAGSNKDAANSAPSNGTEHIAMRVPADGDPGDEKPAVKPETSGDHNAADASQPPSEPATPTKQRLVKFLGGKLTLDMYQHPIIGSPEAPHIAIEMVSYDCPHCHKMYAMMQHALERYGDQVALLIMVQPLDKECNRLVTDPAASHQGACATARLVMGIAKLNPSGFATFHDFLMADKEKPPSMGAIIPKAYVLADRSRLRELTQSDELRKQLDFYIDLYNTLQRQSNNKSFGLPVQILGDRVMSGAVESEADVFKAWEENLGVKPK